MLVGDNAQGKTSLLEAIYFLATFTSFHAQNDRQLINFNVLEQNPAVARIVADFEKGQHKHRLEVRLILESGGNGSTRTRKEILLDGVKRTVNEAIGKFNAVLFLPQMTHILENGPDERRRYLNLALSQAYPGYALALSEYTQVVTQRNALLKQLFERGGDPEQLSFWDEQLCQRGSVLIHTRIAATQELERLASRIHERLTNGSEILRLDYQPSYDPLPQPDGQLALRMQIPAQRASIPLEQIRQGFWQRVQELRGEEIQRGVTTIGPHRDELRFMGNGIDLIDFGSRGQVRTTLLSLKLAEAAWLKEKTGQWPVLLLDEILAELDLQRRADLLKHLVDSEQVIITTTDLNLFQADFITHSTVWQIEGGRIVPPL